MSAKVRIPTPLRRLTGGKDVVQVEGSSLKECISALEQQFPGIEARLCDPDGELHDFVNIYVNGEDVRFMEGMATEVKPNDELSIVPAVAGG
ncbi:MAG: MoaD/ThiS family protein [Chloroflexi bacterium]|nr:MoaD/ThiS family protein [Chloroflexota bacterium]